MIQEKRPHRLSITGLHATPRKPAGRGLVAGLKIMVVLISLGVLLLGASLGGPCINQAWAKEAGTGFKPVPEGATPKVDTSFKEYDPKQTPVEAIDKAHAEISQTIEFSAGWLDSFFDDRRHHEESNTTRFRLKTISVWRQDDGWDVYARPDLRLVAPAFNRRFHLLISGDPDNDPDADASPTEAVRERFEESQDRSVSAALQFHFIRSKLRNLSLLGGVRFRHSGVAFFAGPRYRELFQGKVWALRFTQSAKALTDIGWELETTVDVERPLGDKFFFRSTTDGNWFQDEAGYYYDQTFALFQIIDDKQVLVYEQNNYLATTLHNQLQEANFRLRYRRKIWRDWVVVEVAPELALPEKRDYKVTPGIIFRLELTFGGTAGTGNLY